MAAFAITRWMLLALQWLPAPLHRALDAWSARRAQRRKWRRVRLKARCSAS